MVIEVLLEASFAVLFSTSVATIFIKSWNETWKNGQDDDLFFDLSIEGLTSQRINPFFCHSKMFCYFLPTSKTYNRISKGSAPGACEKVASDLGLVGGFLWVHQFPPPVTTG